MEMGGLWGGFFNISQKIARFAYVNALWVIFTLLGGIVFGIMPATAALFSIMRKVIQGKDDFRLFQAFWKVYKAEFIKTNILGLIVFTIGYLLYFNLNILQSDQLLLTVLRYFMIFFVFLYIILTLFLFPVFVHYKLNLLNYLKMSLLIGLRYPQYVGLMIIGLVFLQYLFMFVPGIIPFFGISLIGYIIMWIADKVFKMFDGRHEKAPIVNENIQMS